MSPIRAKELGELISLRTLQKIQDSFSVALGMPLSIRNIDGELLTRISNESKLWSLVKNYSDTTGEYRLILKEAFGKCLRTGQVIIFDRYIGTKAFAAPININGKIAAFFVGGLVRFGNPSLEDAEKEAKRLNIDLDDYLEAFLELSLLTPERLQAAANLIKVISNTISSLEFKGNEIKVKTDKIERKNQELAKHLKKASLALNMSEEKFDILFQNIKDGIYMADMEGRMLEINPAGAKMFGFDNPDQIKGKYIRDYYIHPKDREKFVKILLKDGHIENFLAMIRTQKGENKFYETSAILVRDKAGKPIGIQGIFRDIYQREHRNLE